MLQPLSPANASAVRTFLTESGFTEQEFRSRPNLRELSPTTRAFLLDYTREPSRFNVLLRLLLFTVEVNKTLVEELIPAEILAPLRECGVLSVNGDQIRPEVMLTPLANFWFAADPMTCIHEPEVVLWANQTTRIVDLFSIRAQVGATLDLGSGCGVLSVMAAGHSGTVVATDLNPRAEAFTRFNASLNGVSNIECFTGDTYETVKGRAFDLILANPPFFVTPTSSQLFCENSMALDGYCRRVVREGAPMLTEGGYMMMTLEWVQQKGQPWQERLAEWLDGAGCDAWILRAYTRDPGAYAQERLKNEMLEDAASTRRKFENWAAYYREQNVEQICGGMMILRRRSGESWLRVEDLTIDVSEPVGDLVERVFANQTILSAHPSDEELIALRPRLGPECRLDQKLRQAGGKWEPASLDLSMTRGLPGLLSVEWPVVQFLAYCDGSRTLGELIAGIVATVRAPEAAVRSQCCAVVRKLAERRFLAL